MSRRIWCAECVCDNAESLHRWVFRGRATARGGALKVELCCTTCRRPLAVGTYAEAVTLHAPGVVFERWESEVVLLPEGRSGGICRERIPTTLDEAGEGG